MVCMPASWTKSHTIGGVLGRVAAAIIALQSTAGCISVASETHIVELVFNFLPFMRCNEGKRFKKHEYRQNQRFTTTGSRRLDSSAC